MRRWLRRRAIRFAASASLAILVLSLVSVAPAPAPALAVAGPDGSAAPASRTLHMANLASFRAGNIISNAVFFDSSTMSEAQIGVFLRQRVATCQAGYTCLKDFAQATTTRAADAYCSGYSGEGWESAARIIWKVAQSCGINPQVLIVTLQKEQGLVTHTAPTEWRYTIAMGQGCPDTAACDTRYYGFFNQVYGAARQFRVYTEGRYFTYYAPGRTWNLLYNPNSACGSSPVYIENQATANLYYYTPYQPNAAALASGYGTGDGCSAYGNRNFYNYFTDWFGSTQNRVGSLVQAEGRGEVYLVSSGLKYHLLSYSDLVAYSSRLGQIARVSTRYVDEMPSGGSITRYVHDTRSGTLYLIEPDGTKHRFASVDQVALFGYPFNSYVNVEYRILDSFTTGTDIGPFFHAVGAQEVYFLEDGARRYVADSLAWYAVSQGRPPYIASMDAAAAAVVPLGATYFAPYTLVRGRTSADVYVTTSTSTIIHTPSFARAAEFGATRYTVVDDALLANSAPAPDPLGTLVQCGEDLYIGAGGIARPYIGSTDGFDITHLTAADCASLSRAGSPVSSPVFVQPSGDGRVLMIEDGTLRHVRSYARLLALNGSRPLTILTWSATAAAEFKPGAPFLEDGSFVQFAGLPEVYAVTNGLLDHIRDYATLVRLGGGRVPYIEALPADYKTSYELAPSP